MTSSQIYENAITLIDEKIKATVKKDYDLYNSLIDAMNYSLLAGGKRLRPALLLEFYRLCGGKFTDDALCFAAALEFIHTYSLIHDDLPCMDNDDMRRGKPSCHIKFGEDTALLAGDALLTMAFSLTCETKNTDAELVLNSVKVLADNAGTYGMVGGQVIDLALQNQNVSTESVLKMYSLKTGALIKSACVIGCILAGADDKKIKAAEVFSENIGLAFQIEDDILDITSSSDILGKPVGSDDKNDKSTYVSIVGLNKSIEEVKTLTNKAIDALKAFDDTDALIQLAKDLVYRNK